MRPSLVLKVLTTGAIVLSVGVFSTPALADEREDLKLILTQIENMHAVALRAKTSSLPGRYQFDYTRFFSDLSAIEQGIQQYMVPSRAQPRDLFEPLSGNYREEHDGND